MVANVEILWRFYWNRQSMMYRWLCTIRFHINRNVYDALEHVMDFQIGQIHAVIDDLSNGLFMWMLKIKFMDFFRFTYFTMLSVSLLFLLTRTLFVPTINVLSTCNATRCALVYRQCMKNYWFTNHTHWYIVNRWNWIEWNGFEAICQFPLVSLPKLFYHCKHNG